MDEQKDFKLTAMKLNKVYRFNKTWETDLGEMENGEHSTSFKNSKDVSKAKGADSKPGLWRKYSQDLRALQEFFKRD